MERPSLDNIFKSQATVKQESRPALDDIFKSEPKRKANLLDLLSIGASSFATGQGRLLAEGASGMLGNIPKASSTIKESLKPQTPGEKISLAGANIAGAVSPASPINKAGVAIATGVPKLLGGSKLAQAAGYGLAGGFENIAFMPENTKEYLNPKKMLERGGVGAALGVAVPAAVGAVSGVARGIGNVLKDAPEKLINEILGSIPKKDIKYRHNPMRGILKEKLASNDILGVDDLLDKVSTRADEIGQRLDFEYSNTPGRFNMRDTVMQPIRNAYKELDKFPSSRQTLRKQLDNVLMDFKNKKLDDMTAKEAWMLSREIRDNLARFRGTAADDSLTNEVFQDISRSLTAKIKEINPAIKELSQTYGDLLSAENLLSNQTRLAGSRQIFSPSAKAGGGLAAGVRAKSGEGLSLRSIVDGVLAAGAVKVAQTPYLKTRLANALNGSKVQDIAEMMSKSPKFIDLFNSAYGVKVKTPDEVKSVTAEIMPDLFLPHIKQDIPEQVILGQSPQSFDFLKSRAGQQAIPGPTEYSYLAKGSGIIPKKQVGIKSIASWSPDEWVAQRNFTSTYDKAKHMLEGKRLVAKRIRTGKSYNKEWLKRYPDLKKLAKLKNN